MSAFGAAAGLIGAGVINKAISAYASNYIEADLQEDGGQCERNEKYSLLDGAFLLFQQVQLRLPKNLDDVVVA